MNDSFSDNYLENVRTLFRYYKQLGDGAMAQVADEDLKKCVTSESNSIAIIVKHMSGNMLSRWTDFLNSDGEKEWRNREGEFEDTINNRAELLAVWEKGWTCLFAAIDPLQSDDFQKLAYIRNEGHSIVEAINRQLGHYSYHVGQIVFLARFFVGKEWESLSIAKGASKQFNAEKFKQDKQRKNFV